MPKKLIDTNRLNTADVEFIYEYNGELDNHVALSHELENFITEQDYCEHGQEWEYLLDQFDYVTQEYWRLWS